MDRKKDSNLKARPLPFYNPTNDDLLHNSLSTERKSQKFLRKEPPKRNRGFFDPPNTQRFDDSNTTSNFQSTPALREQVDSIIETKTIILDDSHKSPIRKLNTAAGLPLLAKITTKELEKCQSSPILNKISRNTLIENVMAKEQRLEISRVYQMASEFRDLKLSETSRGLKDTSRIITITDKLSDDKIKLTASNIQSLRHDRSHLFTRNKCSPSPLDKKTLPDIKKEFKSKFTQLIRDIKDDRNTSPTADRCFTATRLNSNLLDNNIKTDRFFTCESSQQDKHSIFLSLHSEIHRLKSPTLSLGPKKEHLPTSNDKRGLSTEEAMSPGLLPKDKGSPILGPTISHPNPNPHPLLENEQLVDSEIVLSLKKELPNVFSANPSNRQEVLNLGNWLINTVKTVQDDVSLALRDKYYKADEVYNICFSELVRQVSIDCLERGELIMKIWKSYLRLTHDIIEDYKQKDRHMKAKAAFEIEKAKLEFEDRLKEKDLEIEKVKQEVLNMENKYKEREDTMKRYTEDRREALEEAKHAKDMFAKIQKFYSNMKQEHRDLNFKYDKLKKRFEEGGQKPTDGDSLTDLYVRKITSNYDSDSSEDVGARKANVFGNPAQKIIRTEARGTSINDLLERIESEKIKPVDMETQTNLTLVDTRFNSILKNNKTLDNVIREEAAKQKLIKDAEFLQNMREKHKLKTSGYISNHDFGEQESGGSKSKVSSLIMNSASTTQENFMNGMKSPKLLGLQQSNQITPKANTGLLYTINVNREKSEHSGSSRLVQRGADPNSPNNDADDSAVHIQITNHDQFASQEESTSFHGSDSDDNILEIVEGSIDRRIATMEDTPSTLGPKKLKNGKKAAPRKSARNIEDEILELLGESPGRSFKRRNTKKGLAGLGIKAKNSPALLPMSPGGATSRTSRSKNDAPSLVKASTFRDLTTNASEPLETDPRHQRFISDETKLPKEYTEGGSLDNINEEPESQQHLDEKRQNFNQKNRPRHVSVGVKNAPAQVITRKKGSTFSQSNPKKPSRSRARTLEFNEGQVASATTAKPSADNKSPIREESPGSHQEESPNSNRNSKKASTAVPKKSSLLISKLGAMKTSSPLNSATRSHIFARESNLIRGDSFNSKQNLSNNSSIVETVKAISVMNIINKLVEGSKVEGKKQMLTEIEETLKQVDQENEEATNWIEAQEDKVLKILKMYKIEKIKQEDLQNLASELEQQVSRDGALINSFRDLLDEVQKFNLSDDQKLKLEQIKASASERATHLEVIEHYKPRSEMALPTGKKGQDGSPRKKLMLEELGSSFKIAGNIAHSYKGDFGTELVLTPAQKHMIIDKANLTGQNMVSKIRKEIQAKRGKLKASLPIKSILKQLTAFYSERLHQGKENPMLKEQDLGIFVYKQFINTYGNLRFGLKKFVKFVVSVKFYSNVNRILNFARLLGMCEPEDNFSLQEVKQYFNVLEFLMYNANAGVQHQNVDWQKNHFVPFVRVLEYIKHFGEKYGEKAYEELHELRKEIEKVKIADPTRVNSSGLIDVDIFAEKMVLRYRNVMNKVKDTYMSVYLAADVLKEDKVRYGGFNSVYKAIEGEVRDEKKLEEAFINYSDLIKEDYIALSMEQFFALCFDLNIFSENKVNGYLGAPNEAEFEKKYEDFLEIWPEKYSKIMDIIKENQANVPNDISTKWKNILKQMISDKGQSEIPMQKSVMVRYRILWNDVEMSTHHNNSAH